MGYKVGHKRETIAKATTKGSGKATDKFPGGSGKAGMANAPKLGKSKL